ncbi:putative membrane protein [Povalibacter uvarum]|uniref:Putative membrane protein n=1 Tax=Povalibacter uvarum TaxID=732238 RepID=A0A841HV30_9GAMM|nr:DUF2189 domain-containing protein [Povalibacter uvarum]MBB6096040.1 putative membrane protein [Povalibacter uvarum]
MPEQQPGNAGVDLDLLPLAAPCRVLAPSAPLHWLRMGWSDLRRAGLPSLFYGMLLTALSALIAYATWRFGTLALYLGLATGFVFIGPFLAMGLYSISYQLEIGRKPTLSYSLQEGRSHLPDTLVLGLCLLVVLLVWARAATVMSIFQPDHAIDAWTDLLAYFGIGALVGLFFASIVLAATAFSLPMLLDRRTDAITAVVTSINATLRNKLTLALWGALIACLVLIGFATFLVGFVILMPLIGHATWHAYRSGIDASAWPPTHEEAETVNPAPDRDP